MAFAIILDFWNREILLAHSFQSAKMHHRSKFYQNRSFHCWDIEIFYFLRWRPFTIFISFGLIWTTHELYLVVSITVQNLVTIKIVVSEIWKFQYLAWMAGKRLFTLPELGFLRCNMDKTPKGACLCETALFEPSNVKIHRPVWPVGELPKRGV